MDNITLVFGNVEPIVFDNKTRLQHELRSLCDKGIVFFHVRAGKVLMRPEIRVFGEVEILAKCLALSGDITYHHFKLMETQYEGLSFN